MKAGDGLIRVESKQSSCGASSRSSDLQFWEGRILDGDQWEEKIRSAEASPRRDFLVRHLRGKSPILEAGCGDGKFAAYLRACCDLEVIGLDFSRTATLSAKALTRFSGGGREGLFIRGDIRRVSLADGTMEGYVSMGVLEHYGRREQMVILNEAHRVLRSGGVIVVTVPNFYSPWTVTRSLWSLFRRIGGKPLIYQKNLAGGYLKRLLTESGFHHVSIGYIDVRSSFEEAFLLDHPTVKGFPNPLYPLGRFFRGLSAWMEKAFPFMAYHLAAVGEKP